MPGHETHLDCYSVLIRGLGPVPLQLAVDSSARSQVGDGQPVGGAGPVAVPVHQSPHDGRHVGGAADDSDLDVLPAALLVQAGEDGQQPVVTLTAERGSSSGDQSTASSLVGEGRSFCSIDRDQIIRVPPNRRAGRDDSAQPHSSANATGSQLTSGSGSRVA